MTDTNALRGKIVGAGYTQKSFAEAVGISENAFSAKINNKDGACFDVIEAERICDALNITSGAEKASIFLSKVSQK